MCYSEIHLFLTITLDSKSHRNDVVYYIKICPGLVYVTAFIHLSISQAEASGATKAHAVDKITAIVAGQDLTLTLISNTLTGEGHEDNTTAAISTAEVDIHSQNNPSGQTTSWNGDPL